MSDSCKTKTDLEMENVRLRRRLMEAEQRAERMGRRVPTERERRILEMWPRFDDGEPVTIGDGVAAGVGNITAEAIEFTADGVNVKDGADGDWSTSAPVRGRLKRPAPEVLDADGVPISEGDTVWANGHKRGDGREWTVTGLDLSTGYSVKARDRRGTVRELRPKWLTHARPDSWERLEDDARLGDCDYFGSASCDGCRGVRAEDCATARILDMVGRAKRLAGVE